MSHKHVHWRTNSNLHSKFATRGSWLDNFQHGLRTSHLLTLTGRPSISFVSCNILILILCCHCQWLYTCLCGIIPWLADWVDCTEILRTSLDMRWASPCADRQNNRSYSSREAGALSSRVCWASPCNVLEHGYRMPSKSHLELIDLITILGRHSDIQIRAARRW